MNTIKRSFSVLIAAWLVVLGTTAGFALEAPVRILPLGDSLTAGSPAPGAYRNRLYELLTSSGYNADFIGTFSDDSNPGLPDVNHQGLGGARIDEIQTNLDGWLGALENPDVVLLLIGTNDFYQSYELAGIQTRLSNLISDIATKRPYAKIIVSSLPPRTDSASIEAQQVAYNAAIPNIVSQQVSLGRQVSFVDMHAALTPLDLGSDGVHPTSAGNIKMGNAWFSAIAGVISPQGTSNPPVIVRAEPSTDLSQVVIGFSKPVADSAANTANFSIPGLSIDSAVLDPAGKRTITLDTSPQTRGLVYSLSVSGVVDRTAQQTPIAPESMVNFSSGLLLNGSFEQVTGAVPDHWTVSGNYVIETSNTYPNRRASDGGKMAAFNVFQLAPNAVFSQAFTTTPGETYLLQYDLGVYAFNNSSQQMRVTVTGNSTLLSRLETLAGDSSQISVWVPKSYLFTADSAVTILSFEDQSPTSDNLDLLLDNVRVALPAHRSLAVTSTPSTGAAMTISAVDTSGNGDGSTGLIRSYDPGTAVTVTAPAIHSGRNFLRWQKNGVDLPGSQSAINVTMDDNYSLNAVYSSNSAPVAVLNGSFESGASAAAIPGIPFAHYSLDGWAASGNAAGFGQVLPNVPATNGVRMAIFNGANETFNGVIVQTFPTTPGVVYQLEFDAGIIGGLGASQLLGVAVDNGSVFSADVPLTATAGGVAQWTAKSYTFTAAGATSTLTFTDKSGTLAAGAAINCDLLLDHVRVTGSGAGNTAPVADNDSYLVTQDTALVVPAPGVLDGDTDGESDPLTAVQVAGPAHGTLALNANGGFSYVPDSGFSGTDSFSYKANDGSLDSNVATVTIAINASVATDLANGSFELGSPAAANPGIPFAHFDLDGWAASGNAAGFGQVPPNVPATDGVRMAIFNGANETFDGLIAQSFPTVPGAVYQLQFDAGIIGGAGASQLLGVAVDNGSVLAEDVLLVATTGGVSQWTAKSYTFTAAGTTSTLTFTDKSGTLAAGAAINCDLLLDHVRVTGSSAGNTAPVADNDSYSTMENMALVVAAPGVLDGDTDGESDPLTAVQVAGPAHGTLALNANGGFTYIPNSGFSGTDSFSYKANDGSLDSNVATVAIAVNVSVPTDLANGSFEQGAPAAANPGIPFAHFDLDGWTASGNAVGFGRVLPNVPATDGVRMAIFNGANETFDGVLAQTFSTVPGVVYQLQFDAGIIGGSGASQLLGVMVDDGSVLSEDVPLTTTVGGVTQWTAKSYTFTAAGATSTLTFTDKSGTLAAGAAINCDMLLDHVRVTGSSVTNTAPVADNESYSATQDTVLVVAAPGVLEGDTDGESDPLTAIQVAGPAHGTLALNADGGFSYTPDSGFSGTDSFTYQASDGSLDSNVATVFIAVNAPGSSLLVNGSFEAGYSGWSHTGNQSVEPSGFYTSTDGVYLVAFNAQQAEPNGVLSQGFATVPGRTYQLSFDMGALSYTDTAQRLQVTVDGVANLLSQTIPVTGPNGGDIRWLPQAFSFTADSTTTVLTFRDVSTTSDGIDMVLDHVRVTEAPADSPPVVVADTYYATKDTLFSVAAPGVLGNDSDPELQALSAVLDSPTTHGTLALNADGSFTYTPDAGFTGIDSFEYRAGDGSQYSAKATVSIIVNTAVPSLLINGSFESGYSAWTHTGNQSVEPSAFYTATDGNYLVAFNAQQAEPNGVLSQSFATVPGRTYQLAFDMGALSYIDTKQRLQVTLDGTGNLLSQTIPVTGPDGGNIRWLPQSFSFTADSATTVLTFRDVSTTSDGIDLVLDNVRVTESTIVEPGDDFAGWLIENGVLGGPDDDSDGDAISALLEYVIGGDPVDGIDSGLLPTAVLRSADLDGIPGLEDYLLFTYRLTQRAASDPTTIVKVEWTADLAGAWYRAHGTPGVVIRKVTHGAGSGVNLMKVYLPRTLAVDGKLFARLKVSLGEVTD